MITIAKEPLSLLNRVDRVINTNAFERVLNNHFIKLFEFQLDWPNYKNFKDFPIPYQSAILAGEEELRLTEL